MSSNIITIAATFAPSTTALQNIKTLNAVKEFVMQAFGFCFVFQQENSYNNHTIIITFANVSVVINIYYSDVVHSQLAETASSALLHEMEVGGGVDILKVKLFIELMLMTVKPCSVKGK